MVAICRMGRSFLRHERGSKEKSAFLVVIGPTTYGLLRNLVSPAKPGDKSYEDLVKILKDHFNQPPSKTVQRSGFNSQFRKADETVATFVAELRALAEFCNFGTLLEDMIQDRLICGISDTEIQQQKLLADKSLTLKTAVEIAQGMETGARNAQEMAQQETTSNPSKLSTVQSEGLLSERSSPALVFAVEEPDINEKTVS